jgi:preprotein translocase subunit SecA
MFDVLLKKLFGDKSKNDLKELAPIAEEVNNELINIEKLNDDELRGQTAIFKKQIADATSSIHEEINSLSKDAKSSELSITEKEAIFIKIEELEKSEDELIEQTLLDIMPKAFAVVKETATRWTNNGKLNVKANEYDVELSSKFSNISIKEDSAEWVNQWDAAGTLP